jgi:hypothetical protein
VGASNLLACQSIRVIGGVVRAAGLCARDCLRELRLEKRRLATENLAEPLHDSGARCDVRARDLAEPLDHFFTTAAIVRTTASPSRMMTTGFRRASASVAVGAVMGAGAGAGAGTGAGAGGGAVAGGRTVGSGGTRVGWGRGNGHELGHQGIDCRTV